MPLTAFQKEVVKLLSCNKNESRYLAGGAALHVHPQSTRYSYDLDYFHDSEKEVHLVFEEDKKILESKNYDCTTELQFLGYIRCIVSKGAYSTKVEWAHDSAWRFFPLNYSKEIGYTLNDIDLAINKLLALVGREEPRDFIDIFYIHKKILHTGSLCWAACGKDPGYTPDLLLDILKRRGRYREQDFKSLNLNQEIDLVDLKKKWLGILDEIEVFIKKPPPESLGSLFYSQKQKKIIHPKEFSDDILLHFGALKGIVPVIPNSY